VSLKLPHCLCIHTPPLLAADWRHYVSAYSTRLRIPNVCEHCKLTI